MKRIKKNLMSLTLKCGCQVTEEGKFIVGEVCMKARCGECRTVSKLHPFGDRRFADLMFRGID